MAALSGTLPVDIPDLNTQDLGRLPPVQFNSRKKKSFKEDQVCVFLGLFKEIMVLFLARVSHLPCPASSPATEVIMSFGSSLLGSVLIPLTYLFLAHLCSCEPSIAPLLPSLHPVLASGKDAGDKERLVWDLCLDQTHYQLPGLT